MDREQDALRIYDEVGSNPADFLKVSAYPEPHKTRREIPKVPLAFCDYLVGIRLLRKGMVTCADSIFRVDSNRPVSEPLTAEDAIHARPPVIHPKGLPVFRRHLRHVGIF